MTLTFDRQVLAGGSEYSGYVTNAVNAWNNGAVSTNTTYLAEYSPANWHDIHLTVVAQDGCYSYYGLQTSCLQGAAGRTAFFNASQNTCGCSDGKIWYSSILINQQQFASQSLAFKKDAVVHELGHALGTLQDIPIQPAPPDGLCYTGPRPRIMDYDCVWNSTYDGPQPFDSCAINHMYYDPNWVFAGC